MQRGIIMTQGFRKVKRGKSSEYLLTNMFNIEYFHRTKPALILAYLIPFRIDNYLAAEDTDTYDQIADLIQNNRFGISSNFASQGIARYYLYKKNINISYYYEQLGKLNERMKSDYLSLTKKNEKSTNNRVNYCDIESNLLKNDLSRILSIKKLYFKVGHEIYPDDREKMIEHLQQKSNRYVMAELLYYITSSDHTLPDVDDKILERATTSISSSFETKNNVCLSFRNRFDETEHEMEEKLSHVKEFFYMGNTGSAFFNDRNIENKANFYSVLEHRIRQADAFLLRVILMSPNSLINEHVARYRMSPNCINISKEKLVDYSIEGIRKLIEIDKNRTYGKITDLCLPYALCIFKFYDESMDYIKIDLYSPYIDNNEKRPSVVIYRIKNEKLFEHFSSVFRNVWNDEKISAFIEGNNMYE